MDDTKKTNDEDAIFSNAFNDGLTVAGNMFSATQSYFSGMTRYVTDFQIPVMLSSHYFQRVEGERLKKESPTDSFDAYLTMLHNNLELMNRGLSGTGEMMSAYAKLELDGLTEAMQQIFLDQKYTKLAQYIKRQAGLLEMVTHNYPKAIDAIEPEFGFHFETGEHLLFDETDRFLIYRIAPSLKEIKTRFDAKPVLIIPPYVLGANILGFLPGEQRSYAHCFANQGFPTYIRVLKDIDSSPAIQLMTGEDDARDTARFCKAIMKEHGKPVTLNGYCQGGFNSLCSLLSGELDGLVDAFITCVAPMDGTRSKGLARFLAELPPQFNDLAYGTKILPNGNKVADGQLMGWVYKLKSIEHEIPAAAFFRHLTMFARQPDGNFTIGKTAAAMNYWLNNERFDLPLAIAQMSFLSYNVPITKDGTLPVRLFDRKLNLKRLQEKKIPWLICYGIHDDLVEKETALAPLDYIDAEVTPFPKGHVAIATSWSSPDSDCALHTRFGDGNYRGPVLFHMDIDAALTESDNNVPKVVEQKAVTATKPKARIAKQNQVKKPASARKTSPAKKVASKATAARPVPGNRKK